MPDSQLVLLLAGASVAGYLLGSINSAIVLSRLMFKDDIRRHGSGNAGMTNMLRIYGKKAAALTAAGDFLKAAAAIALSRMALSYLGAELPLDIGYIAGFFALLGHLFPVYFRFKGGKGIMSTLGIIFCVNPLAFLIIAVTFVPLVLLVRIVSLMSVLGAIIYPFLTWAVLAFQNKPVLYDTLCSCVFAVIVLIMHRENIKRLIKGTEPRFSRKRKSQE